MTLAITENDETYIDSPAEQCPGCNGDGVIEGTCNCSEDSCACEEMDPKRCDICDGVGTVRFQLA